ncbi:hypothetical protein [Methylobacter sp. YRD-M1]|uniref:hypothetical protein n=1 Tax=Methylobacter sp. YRD-M1 TaxID=2911520 RepID=UPI00227BA03A|nr:hypothetical protein [Methylobacter sp. YRD-M1]WAK02523.1 hypothetical protein LZ558_01670 [Methylobacter sp. YRD-M1]
MNSLEGEVYMIGAGLLFSLGTLSLWVEGQRLKRVAAQLFILVLGVLLADALIHRLPNALAGFIYGTHHHFASKGLRSDK